MRAPLLRATNNLRPNRGPPKGAIVCAQSHRALLAGRHWRTQIASRPELKAFARHEVDQFGGVFCPWGFFGCPFESLLGKAATSPIFTLEPNCL
jgi:hypothetical protein